MKYKRQKIKMRSKMEDRGLWLEDIFFNVSRQLIAVYIHVQVIT